MRVSNGEKKGEKVTSAQLRVGDVIELMDQQTVPADCLLLSAENSSGQCFIQTASLDGEKNLKPKMAI